MGRIPSKDFSLHIHGHYSTVSESTDVWNVGGVYEFPIVAFQTEVVGGASDIPSSNGIHSVNVEGLDINGIEITEVATLNGAIPVVLTNSYFRINDLETLLSGGVEVNSFNIGVSHTGSATLARINAGDGRSMMAIYTTPNNIAANFLRWHGSASRPLKKDDVSAAVSLQQRQALNGGGWRTVDAAEITDVEPFNEIYSAPKAKSLTIKPFSDIRIRITGVSTNAVIAHAGFEIEGHRSL